MSSIQPTRANAVTVVGISICMAGGALIAWSDFVPAPSVTIPAYALAATAAAIAAAFQIGVGAWQLDGIVGRYDAKERKWTGLPWWAKLLILPLYAGGTFFLAFQFFGNVLPWAYTSLLGRPGTMTVTTAGWAEHRYAHPNCTYPELLNIPGDLIGHVALCNEKYGTMDVGAPLVLVGRRSTLGIRVSVAKSSQAPNYRLERP